MAPEIVHKTPYDYRIDIWALGILLYELIHGEAPFRGRNITDITRSLAMKTIRFSSSVSPHAKDLITNILKTNPAERLSLHQIFNHSWVLAGLTNLNKREKPLNEPLKIQLPENKAETTSAKGTTGADSKTATSFSLTSLTPTNQLGLKNQLGSHAISMNQLPNDTTPSSTITGKINDPKKLQLYPHESPAKENAIHPIKSPSTSHLTFLASGNLSSRDKENKDFISFAGLSDLRRKESTTHHYHSFVNLKSFDQKYPATTTHLESKEKLIINRQHSDSITSRPGGLSIDKTRIGNIDMSVLSPTYKSKIGEIMTMPSPQMTGRNESLQNFTAYANLTQRTPLQNVTSKGLNSPTQGYTNPFLKENTLRSPVNNARKGLGVGSDLKKANDKYQIGISQTNAMPFVNENRSPSLAMALESRLNNLYQPTNSREPCINFERGPRYHFGDEIVPSLTASFCGTSFPVNGSTEGNANAKKPVETEANANLSKPDDEHAVKQVFTQCYRGIEAKKKIDIDRLAPGKKL